MSHTLTAKPGGGTWTDADLDAWEAGIELASGSASAVRVTQIFVTVNVGNSATYTYADGPTGMNTLTSLVKNGATTSFAYDADGNLDTKTGGWDYDWNFEDLMSFAVLDGIRQQVYVYDGLGRRAKIEGASSTTWTVSVFAGTDVLYETDQSGAVTKYIYANDMGIARVDFDPAVGWPAARYYLSDALGSTRQLRDASKDLVFRADYDPFGKPYDV